MDIPGFPNYVLLDFQVYRKVSENTLRKIKTILMANGYYAITMTNTEGKQKKIYMHRLIAKAHLPNPENKETVNHIDGNRTNNTLSNLEWATNSEQQLNIYRVREVKKKGRTLEVWNADKTLLLYVFSSISDGSKFLSVDRDTIYNEAKKNRVYNGVLFVITE